MRRVTLQLAAALAVALALALPASSARPDKVTLHPMGFGQHSYASWKAQEGQPDATGGGNHALYFQKFTETNIQVAGIVEFEGLEGRPIGAITGLEWEHRTDGWCGAGAPRWTTISEDTTGRRYVTHQGCAAAVHTPTAPNWVRDTQPSGPAGQPCVLLEPPFPTVSCAGNTIVSLWIVFDEGTTLGGLPWPGPGYTYLDNIKVVVNGVPHVWTGPADNAS
jgi:hypothetical protein